MFGWNTWRYFTMFYGNSYIPELKNLPMFCVCVSLSFSKCCPLFPPWFVVFLVVVVVVIRRRYSSFIIITGVLTQQKPAHCFENDVPFYFRLFSACVSRRVQSLYSTFSYNNPNSPPNHPPLPAFLPPQNLLNT